MSRGYLEINLNTLLLRKVWQVAQENSDHGKDACLRDDADRLVFDLSVLYHDESGDAHNTETSRKLLLIVDIYLADLDVDALLRYLVHNRGEHTAGSAPACPKIYENGFFRVRDFFFEVLACYCND